MRPLAILLLLGAPALAPAQVITANWTGATGNWTDPALWVPAVPNNGTPPGATYDAVVNGAGTLTLDQAIAVQKLDLAAGTVTGGSGLTLNDKFTWSGGTLAGGGTTAANVGATFQGGTKTLSRALTLGGAQSDWTGGDLATTAGGVLTNSSGSLLRAAVIGSVTGGGSVANAGTFRRVDAGGETTLAVPLTNTGRVEAHEGTLALAGGGASSGAFDLGQRAALRFSSAYTLNAGSSLGNTGTVAFSGGAVAVGVPYSPRVTMMNGGSATFTTSARTHDLYLDSAALAVNAPFTLTGAGTWVGGALAVNAGGSLTTGDGSLFLAHGPRDIAGAGAITNHGTFRRSGDGSTAVSPSFTNFGTVEVTAGTLALAGGINHGAMTVAAGAALRFSGDFTVPVSGGGISGAGTVAFSGGTQVVNTPYAVGATVVNGGHARFEGPGTANLGAATFANGGVTLKAPAMLTGQSSWTGVSVIDAQATLTNAAGATFTVGGGTLALEGTGSLTNAGTLRKSGSTLVTLSVPVTNTGIIELPNQVGNLHVVRPVANTGAYTVGTSAQLRLGGVAGTYALGGTVSGAGTVRFEAGTFDVTGTFGPGTTRVQDSNTRVNFNVATALQSVVVVGGRIAGTGPITIAGDFQWFGGRVEGSGSITVTGETQISAATNPTTIEGRSLRLGNRTTLTGDFALGPAAVVTVPPGGQFSGSEVDVVSYGNGAPPTFRNEGAVHLGPSQRFSVSGTGMTFINAGVVEWAFGNEQPGFLNPNNVYDSRPGSTFQGTLSSEGLIRGSGSLSTVRVVRPAAAFPPSTIAPGDPVAGSGRIGTLSLFRATFQGGTAYAADLGSANPRAGATPADVNTNDRLAISNSLTFDTANALNVLLNVDGTGLSFQHGQTYDWFLASFGSISGFDPARFTITPSNFSGGGSFTLQQSGNNLVLSFTAAPEPSTLLLCGAAAAGFCWHRRRKGRAGNAATP